MTERAGHRDALERALARRFDALREAESASAPGFAGLLEGSVGAPGQAAALPAAAAAAVAVAALLLVLLPREPSPDELYREVMRSSELLTEDLLSVSPLALPEMMRPPSLYDARGAAPEVPGVETEGGHHDA